MMTIERQCVMKGEVRQVEPLDRLNRTLKSMLREAKKDPDKAFQRIYEGGMIHKDGTLREELFEK